MWKSLILIAVYVYLCKKMHQHKRYVMIMKKLNVSNTENMNCYDNMDEFLFNHDYNNYYNVPL